jgi:uncharacterized paraquat-inducible protein A
MQGIAVVVFLCSMGIPLLKLLCQLAVLLSIRLNIGRLRLADLPDLSPYERLGHA